MINSHTELNNKVYTHTAAAHATIQDNHCIYCDPESALGGGGGRRQGSRTMRGRRSSIRRARDLPAAATVTRFMVRNVQWTSVCTPRCLPNVFLAQGANYCGLIDSIGNTNEFLWHTLHPDPDIRFTVVVLHPQHIRTSKFFFADRTTDRKAGNKNAFPDLTGMSAHTEKLYIRPRCTVHRVCLGIRTVWWTVVGHTRGGPGLDWNITSGSGINNGGLSK